MPALHSSTRPLTSDNEVRGRSNNNEEYGINPCEQRNEPRLILVVVGDEAKGEGANESPGVWRDGMICFQLSVASKGQYGNALTLTLPVFPSKDTDQCRYEILHRLSSSDEHVKQDKCPGSKLAQVEAEGDRWMHIPDLPITEGHLDCIPMANSLSSTLRIPDSIVRQTLRSKQSFFWREPFRI